MKKLMMIAVMLIFSISAFAQQTQQDTTKKSKQKTMKKGHRGSKTDTMKTDTTTRDTTKKW